MDRRKELFEEVARQLQKNYIRLTEIEKLTKELGDALSRSDNEAAQIFLGMRQDEMDKADEGKRGLYAILDAMSAKDRDSVKILLDGHSISGEQEEEAEKIRELSVQIKHILARTIEADRAISRRLAGKDSYYQPQ